MKRLEGLVSGRMGEEEGEVRVEQARRVGDELSMLVRVGTGGRPRGTYGLEGRDVSWLFGLGHFTPSRSGRFGPSVQGLAAFLDVHGEPLGVYLQDARGVFDRQGGPQCAAVIGRRGRRGQRVPEDGLNVDGRLGVHRRFDKSDRGV